jgi:hypothetical protein
MRMSNSRRGSFISTKGPTSGTAGLLYHMASGRLRESLDGIQNDTAPDGPRRKAQLGLNAHAEHWSIAGMAFAPALQ